jgi:hypothetical protein
MQIIHKIDNFLFTSIFPSEIIGGGNQLINQRIRKLLYLRTLQT